MYPAIAGKPRAVIGGATFMLPGRRIGIEHAHDRACFRPKREPQGVQNADTTRAAIRCSYRFKAPLVKIADRRSGPFKRVHDKLNHGG